MGTYLRQMGEHMRQNKLAPDGGFTFGSSKFHSCSSKFHFGSSKFYFCSSKFHFGSSKFHFGSSKFYFGSSKFYFGSKAVYKSIVEVDLFNVCLDFWVDY